MAYLFLFDHTVFSQNIKLVWLDGQLEVSKAMGLRKIFVRHSKGIKKVLGLMDTSVASVTDNHSYIRHHALKNICYTRLAIKRALGDPSICITSLSF